MKSSLVMLSLLCVLIGCAAEAPSTADGAEPGDERSTQPIVVDPVDQGSFVSVCSALEEKGRVLSDYETHRDELSVSYQESDCGGKLSSAVRHEVRVVKAGNGYEFQNETNNFHFPEIETLDSGAMKEICTAIGLGNLTNPVITSTKNAIGFKIAETGHCRNDSQNVCVQVMRGPVSADGTKYTVTENTLVSFRIVRDRRGFYTYKNSKSYSNCSGKSYRTKIATFL